MVEMRETHDADRICACVKDHRPVPTHVVRHHVFPLGEGGPNTEDNIVWLCPTAHENVHVLLRAFKTYEGAPPWEVRRRFSPYIRFLALWGWRSIQAGVLL